MLSTEGILDLEFGTAPVGIISPTLANFTLNGIEEVVDNSIKSLPFFNSVMKTNNLNSGFKLNLAVETVRYSDDFLVTASSQYLINTFILPQIEKFLKLRGLELSKDKTQILTVKEGLDFLGYTLKYREQ
jgi:RNA-directed DNA polymerase